MVENKASAEGDHCWKADEKLVQANSRTTELEAKLTELQQELTVLQTQDKRMPIVQGDQYGFLGSDSEPTSDEPMPMMPASSSQAVGSQTPLPQVNPPTSRITPPWGKGDPLILVTGVLPRPLGKTRAGRNKW